MSTGGDIIEMAAGTYDNQPDIAVFAPSASWTSNVTVQPAAGATVQLSGSTATTWAIYGKHLTLKGLNGSMRTKFFRGADYGVVQNCSFYKATGTAAVAVSSDHVQILNNAFNGAPGECDGLVVASGSTSVRAKDVLIEGNVIKDYLYNPGATHEDGIQLYQCEDVTIRCNVIANVANSCIIMNSDAPGIGAVRIENNFLNKANTNASTTLDLRGGVGPNIVVVNNTVIGSLKMNTSAPGGQTVENNIIGYLSLTTTGEKYNYFVGWNAGVGSIPNSTSHTGPYPVFVNTAANDLHIDPTNTVDLFFGNATNAPATDIDGDPVTSPVEVGADQSSGLICYDGFDYAATTSIGSSADSSTDIGFAGTTWSGTNDVVSPGLTYGTLPVLGNALKFSNSIPADRVVSPAAIPPTHAVVGTDGITRLGKAGSDMWISVLMRADADDATNTLNAQLNLLGAATYGTTKLSIGVVGGGSANWGLKNGGGGITASSVPVVTGVTTLLVAHLQFVSGGGNDIVTLYVNPPVAATPPATPSAVQTGTDVLPFEKLDFKGTRQASADEVAIGTTWQSVVN